VEKGILDAGALKEILCIQVEHILTDIFHWQHGYFYFLEKPVDRETIVNFDPLNIARIATCQGYSIADFRRKFIGRKIIYRPSPYAESKKNKILQTLTPRHRFVFSLIDGTRNIAQIAKFSGVEEAQVINILYQLNTAGIIRQSREIIEYEDKQYNEIARILDSLLEIYTDISHILFYELGVEAATTIQRAPRMLSNHLKDIFDQVPLEAPGRLRKEMILSNMSQYYPDATQRHFFIEAFCELFEYLLEEIGRYLGEKLRHAALAKIITEIKTIDRYANKTALRNHLLETFARLSR
jgi:DNA-binding Lrp family transcriptional regulator